jgi:hypothetical protein
MAIWMSDDGGAHHNDNDDDETTKTGTAPTTSSHQHQRGFSLVYQLLGVLVKEVGVGLSRETKDRACQWRNKIKWREELGPISIGSRFILVYVKGDTQIDGHVTMDNVRHNMYIPIAVAALPINGCSKYRTKVIPRRAGVPAAYHESYFLLRSDYAAY